MVRSYGRALSKESAVRKNELHFCSVCLRILALIKNHVVYLAILHTEAQTDFEVLSIQGKRGWKGEKRKKSASHSLTLTHSSS